MFIDDIISVDVFSYSGHVYNLHTKYGYYNTNNLISGNCRCALLPFIEDEK
jgi:hypothetical protein